MFQHMAAHGHEGTHDHAERAAADIAAAESQSRDVGFEEAFGHLKAYHKAKGNSLVPQSEIVTLTDGVPFKLGKW